jgi:hypothetical protein
LIEIMMFLQLQLALINPQLLENTLFNENRTKHKIEYLEPYCRSSTYKWYIQVVHTCITAMNHCNLDKGCGVKSLLGVYIHFYIINLWLNLKLGAIVFVVKNSRIPKINYFFRIVEKSHCTFQGCR